MKKKYTALLLVLVLAINLFAGCAKAGTPEPAAAGETASEGTGSPSPSDETTADTPESAETEEPAAAQAGSPGPADDSEPAEPSAEAEPAEEEQSTQPGPDGFVHYTSPAGMVYPVGDGSQTITQWTAGPTDADNLDTYNNAYILPYQLSYTGVNLEFIEVSATAVTEQFQLMVASGDWADLMNVGTYYTGGKAQAYVDEVVCDLTGLLPANAPDYWDLVMGLNDVSQSALYTTTDDGERVILDVSGVSDDSMTAGGNVVRLDWLEAQGLTVEDLSTIDGFTDALYTMYDAYHGDWTLLLEANSQLGNCVAWDTAMPNLSVSSSGICMYLWDGVQCGWVSDGYRDYVQWLADLYRDGILNPDYYATTWNAQTSFLQEVAQDTVFCWSSGSDLTAIEQFKPEGSPLEVAPIGMIYADAEKQNVWGTERSSVGMGGMSVTTTSEQLELCLQYMNYNYTDRGIRQSNYGVEGETYTLDADGEPVFTDLIMNNPDIPNVMAASNYYTVSGRLPGVTITARMNVLAGETAVESMRVWTAPVDSTEHNFPADFALTTDETNAINNQIADCVAFGQEMILKFITGNEDLTDENWNDYVAGFTGFGLDTILEVYSNAWAGYQAGTRTAVAAMPAGPGGPPPA